MHKKFLRISTLLSALLIACQSHSLGCHGDDTCADTACHLLCGVRTKYKPATTTWYEPKGTSEIQTGILKKGKLIAEINGPSGKHYVHEPDTIESQTVRVTRDETISHKRIERVRVLSCDGLLCCFLGWLNPFRYCKNDCCNNTDTVEFGFLTGISNPECDECPHFMNKVEHREIRNGQMVHDF